MTNLSPITQIFQCTGGYHPVLDSDTAIKVHEGLSHPNVQVEINKILQEIALVTKTNDLPVISISFQPNTQLSADSKSVHLGSFEIKAQDQNFNLDLSYEQYDNGIKSISISSTGDIDDFNYLINPKNQVQDLVYRKLVEKLFEHFRSQLALSFSSKNSNERIPNCKDNLERIETSPYALVESPDQQSTFGECITRNRKGYYVCQNGDNPISFRNNENPNYSRGMAELLQKLGFKNSHAA